MKLSDVKEFIKLLTTERPFENLIYYIVVTSLVSFNYTYTHISHEEKHTSKNSAVI